MMKITEVKSKIEKNYSQIIWHSLKVLCEKINLASSIFHSQGHLRLESP